MRWWTSKMMGLLVTTRGREGDPVDEEGYLFSRRRCVSTAILVSPLPQRLLLQTHCYKTLDLRSSCQKLACCRRFASLLPPFLPSSATGDGATTAYRSV